MTKERGNGANAIVRDEKLGILVVRQNYGEKKWMLPGGEIERGEAPTHAAQEETEEESGILIDAEDLRLVAYFVQRPKGLVLLYETDKYSGNLIQEPTEEILEATFMKVSEILRIQKSFSFAYFRMILQYLRCSNGLDSIPFEGRLSNPVEFPEVGAYKDVLVRA